MRTGGTPPSKSAFHMYATRPRPSRSSLLLEATPKRPVARQGQEDGIVESEYIMGYRVGAGTRWSNPSVLAFANNEDPITKMLECARDIAMKAIDEGWEGPPFDPRRLADILSIKVIPSGDVRDARLVSRNDEEHIIELNPTRPRVRQRFSLAHEIAHTLFPDWHEAVRNRALHAETNDSEWELEALCNIGAAELLMPAGSMPADRHDGSIDEALELRKRYEVSAEAVLIRTIQLSRNPVSMFSASRIEKGQHAGRYRLDYAIEAQNWDGGELVAGGILPADALVHYCTGIGYTQKGPAGFGADETWLECVGVMGYPGYTYPRVVGYLSRSVTSIDDQPIVYLRGDAVEPEFDGPRIVAFVTNNATANWGGGVARQVASHKPDVQIAFRKAVAEDREVLRLGNLTLIKLDESLYYAPIIAQAGFGKSSEPRIRYEALAEGLHALGLRAAELGASVHLPRIGTGASGGRWEVVREMIEEYVSPLAEVRVYDLPPRNARTRATKDAP